MRLGVADGNRTRDLLHCRRTLYAKSHSNGVIDCHSEPLLVLLQDNIFFFTLLFCCCFWIRDLGPGSGINKNPGSGMEKKNRIRNTAIYDSG